MKSIYIIVIFIISCTLQAQNTLEKIEPEVLYEKIQLSQKPAIIQFWVPNCNSRVEIIKAYQDLEKKHSSEIDFYFIGITNLPNLIVELEKEVNFEYPLYYLGGDINKDLIKRKKKFTNKILKLFGAKKENDFITLYVTNKKNIYFDEKLEIDIKKTLND